MPKDEWTDNDLEEMKRIAEKSSPHSPYFDNIHGYQDLAEIEKVKDWALEMEKHGYSICKIRPNLDAAGNQDDPPDALTEMDGQLVGIEVTDLMEYVSENLIRVVGQGKGTVLKWKLRRREPVFSWCGSTLDRDEKNRLEDEVRANHRKFEGTFVQWTLELFQNRLRQGKPWIGGCYELKPFIASQRVRLPPGKGAARQPGARVAWRAATYVVKRTQRVVKRRY